MQWLSYSVVGVVSVFKGEYIGFVTEEKILCLNILKPILGKTFFCVIFCKLHWNFSGVTV